MALVCFERNLTLKEKSDLLRAFISSKENLDCCESSLVVSKEQNHEMERGKELLTIKEMIDKGFSQLLGFRTSWDLLLLMLPLMSLKFWSFLFFWWPLLSFVFQLFLRPCPKGQDRRDIEAWNTNTGWGRSGGPTIDKILVFRGRQIYRPRKSSYQRHDYNWSEGQCRRNWCFTWLFFDARIMFNDGCSQQRFFGLFSDSGKWNARSYNTSSEGKSEGEGESQGKSKSPRTADRQRKERCSPSLGFCYIYAFLVFPRGKLFQKGFTRDRTITFCFKHRFELKFTKGISLLENIYRGCCLRTFEAMISRKSWTNAVSSTTFPRIWISIRNLRPRRVIWRLLLNRCPSEKLDSLEIPFTPIKYFDFFMIFWWKSSDP